MFVTVKEIGIWMVVAVVVVENVLKKSSSQLRSLCPPLLLPAGCCFDPDRDLCHSVGLARVLMPALGLARVLRPSIERKEG